ncbi:MAG: hypothetical protein E7331_04935 [Clostridiales bacterium]|nr:hypothetical protein [Clostridiales bacterium]
MASNYTYTYSYDSLTSGSYNRSYVPTTRFTISSSVHLPCSEIDFRTGLVKPEYTRRRTQAARLELEANNLQQEALRQSIEKETAKTGVQISMRTFVLVVVSVVLILGLCLIYQTGKIAQLYHEINLTQITIGDYQDDNALLVKSIEDNSTENVIMTAARDRLGMVRRTEKEAIHLTAPETRPSAQQPVQTMGSNDCNVASYGAESACINPFEYSGY